MLMLTVTDASLAHTSQRNARDGVIDAARGAAALGVYVYHYHLGDIIARYMHLPFARLIEAFGAGYAVPLFFLISGYCIHGSEWRRSGHGSRPLDTMGYAKRRFFRIYPAYAVSLLLAVVVGLASGDRYEPGDIASHIFLTQGFIPSYFNSINLVLWTISIEVCFYVVYPAWFVLRRRFSLTIAAGVGIMLSVLSAASYAVFTPNGSLPQKLWFLNLWCGWIVGAALYEMVTVEPTKLRTFRWVCAGFVLLSVDLALSQILNIVPQLDVFYAPLNTILWAWPVAALMGYAGNRVGTADWLRIPVRWLGGVGLFSYSLYLLHEPLIVLRNLIQSALPSRGAVQAVQILWFFIIFLLSWISYRLVEQKFRQSRTAYDSTEG